MANPVGDPVSGAKVVVSDDQMEMLKKALLDTEESTVEKVGEVTKAALGQSVDMIPASSAVVNSTIQTVVATQAPAVASIVNPVVEAATGAVANASVEYLKPKIDPAVDASVNATKEMSQERVSSF